MKFITFAMYDIAKAATVAQASDQAAKMPGSKVHAIYLCGGKPFDGVPPNTIVAIGVREVDSSETLAAVEAAYMYAGATIWAVPVLEVTAGDAASVEKKFKK